ITENGIPVIYNPKQPVPAKGIPNRLIPRQDLIIGKSSGDENYIFSTLESIQVDNEGNIFALDLKEGKIKEFDKYGKHLRTFGKKGPGPGEWQAPSRMHLTPDGKLAILDSGKIAFYSLQGECLSEISTARWRFLQMRIDSRSHIYADNLAFDNKGVSQKLLKFDPGLNLLATVAENQSDIKLPRINIMTDRFVYDIIRGDQLAWAYTTRYEIQILNLEGKTIRKIIKDYEPIPITERDKREIIEERYGEEGPPQGITLEFPTHFYPIFSIVVDDKGWFYVRTHEKDSMGNYLIDVFNSEGIYSARFSLPAADILSTVRQDKLYCLVEENDDGIPQVKRYHLEKK
ncbi:MAG: 6-bladed beta-propeller, partial [Candidatus Aminicenantes bacterium]|nr:6-bladed beta-propeller [Candidatus Aminicenantes bacterium]